MYVLAAHTGLRQGEIFALRWCDVDLETARVTVRRNLVERKGHLSIGEPKSVKSRRTVALPSIVVQALHQHRRDMLAEGNAGADHIFVSPAGKWLRKSNVHRKSFTPIVTRANKAASEEAEKAGTTPALLPPISFHSLRHSHASALLLAGEHPKVVQERLGHSAIAITMDTYSHLVESMDRSAADKIDRLFAVKAETA
jgi:integrase